MHELEAFLRVYVLAVIASLLAAVVSLLTAIVSLLAARSLRAAQ